MNNPDWTPPPPPQEEQGLFSSTTKDYYAGEVRKKATQALIFGILSLVCCPVVFGILGFMAANEAINNIEIYEVERDKKGLAVAGKVLSVVGIVVWVVMFMLRVLVAGMR